MPFPTGRLARLPLFLPFLMLVPALAGAADAPVSVRATLDTVLVIGQRVVFGATTTVTSREDLSHALSRIGVLDVRRGIGLASDVNAGGFRRADIGVTVDGERYHCACPNRMDPPTSLAIPIEVATASYDATSAHPGAGLGGEVSLTRRDVGDALRVRGGLEGNLLRSSEGTATAAVEARRQRLAARWTQGRSYRDAHDVSFGTRYGYTSSDIDYSQGDVSYRADVRGWAMGLQGSLTHDVPYAYLLMDERTNQLWNASVARGPWKVYGSHTNHFMDNGLRTGTMKMSTDAAQTTVGGLGRVAGVAIETYGREWNAVNTIAMGANRVNNHMLPRYRQWSANASRALPAGPLRLGARIGVTRATVTDGAALASYRRLQPDAPLARWFVPFALDATVRRPLGAGLVAAVAEVASESPSAEQLFIVVRRPGMPPTKKPDWIGNPTLDAPVRASLRGQAHLFGADLELGGAWVNDYALPVARRIGTAAWSTFDGERVAIASGRASRTLAWTEWNVAYALGWNLERRVPLAEIPPFAASLTARPPLGRGWEGLARVACAGSQNRVDTALGETRTAPWGQLDLGVAYAHRSGVRASLTVENLTDAYYSNNLAYVRDPFASGLRVTEPGRTIRLGVTLGE